MYTFWLVVRSVFFWLPFLLVTIVIALTLLFMQATPFSWRTRLLKGWTSISLALLKYCCNLRYRVDGLENIPEHGFIIMSQHSSTWETIALQKFFGPVVWVLKKELTRIPIFGWGLVVMDAIALNRGTGQKAMRQLVHESRQRMDEGRALILFPEGTRVLPGTRKPFKIGGAIVAEKTGYAILPIAHNAGEFWPRHSWIKWPGTVRVVIGKPIDPAGKTARQIIEEVRQWVTATYVGISDHQQLMRLGIDPDSVTKQTSSYSS